MLRNVVVVVGLGFLFVTGCASPRGKSIAQKRDYVEHMRETTLQLAEAKEPAVAARAKNAAGYGVFSNIGFALIFGGGGNGYGVVVDNKTGEKTYMRMLRASGGLGIGVKEFKVIVTFHDRETLDKFVSKGWEFGGEASAAATTGEKGGEARTVGSMSHGIDVYEMTDRGVYIRAALQATKVYPDKKLNQG